MKTELRLNILFRLCLVFLIVILTGCNPTQTAEPAPPNTPDAGTPLPPTEPPTEIDMTGFAFDEIIITGPKEDIDSVVNDSGLNLTLLEEYSLAYLNNTNVGLPQFGESAYLKDLPEGATEFTLLFDDNDYKNDLVMRLYKNFGGISSLLTNIQIINDLGNKLKVFADPNYITDPLASGIDSCGEPYSGGGSPYSGGGSPYAGMGLPDGSEDMFSAFTSQWAMGQIKMPKRASASVSTDGVVVGVFDTVPWEDTSQGMDSEMSKSIRINSNDGNIDFSLGVSDPPPGDPPPGGSPLGGPSSAITFSNDIRNHGLFVASLVYAVDPSSEIHLIRVLNNSGCGDLYTISKAIHGFVEWSDKNHFQKTVINLSLGVHVPHASRMINPDVLGALPPQVAALQTAIYEAFRFGAVIVAAAGNDSANLSDAQRMQLPAGYTLKTSAGYVKIVVGVAASNSNMEEVQRSCYSNRGDVAAPGGNGGDGFDEQGNPVSCVARASTWMETPEPCNAMINCGYGVVGLSVPTRENNFPIGLWSGTSFSTPLVTGLAALVLKANDIPNIKVNCVIERGATSSDEALGAGIINISESLGLDPNVACPP